MSLHDDPAIEELSQKRPIAKSVVFGFFFYGFMAGLGILLVLILGWYFLLGPTPPETPGAKEEPAPALKEPSPAVTSQSPQSIPPAAPLSESTASLQKSLEEVFAQVQVANQTKDLSLFLKVYSPTFPQLSQKAQEISKIWKTYDYLAMDYNIQELKPLADDRVRARVTWNIKTWNRHTKTFKRLTRTYQVWFALESDHWQITALEKVK